MADEGLTGYIDERGEWAIEPTWEYAEEFTGGLAMVTSGLSVGYIDRSGRFVWELQE
ncbi:MAG: WG repeat-containing protein [Coriobacteriia bacterium]|nr:WG repeat-containing protein [Coriobacteriia bacterium]